MSIDTRLRDAMRARVAGVDAGELHPLPVRGRRVWPAVTAGFAVVLVAVLAIAVFTSRDDSTSGPATSARYPSRIAAITRDGRLVVLASKNGHVLHTIARGASTNGGISVTPDGRFVYYSRLIPGGCHAEGEPDPTEIVRVPTTGGRATVVASYARLPAVSPDGSSLAFTGVPGCSDAGGAILVKTLKHGSSLPYDRTWEGPQPGEVTSMSWGPDSRHLAFESKIDGYPRILDTDTDVPLAATPRVEIDDGTVWFGYRGHTGDFLAYRFGAAGSPAELESLSTDGTPRRLGFSGTNFAPVALRSDRSGAHLLLVAQDLSAWSPGERVPRRLAAAIWDAAWIPGG